ncbi:MAG: PEGA domain-containing protein [Stenotrophomonas maltophilia]
MITSEPPGALVWLNDREIGRTPVDVDFEFYGRYDVRLHLPGQTRN